MAIKEYIYLLGVEDVEASLKRLSDQGEQALGQFRELGGAGGAQPFAPIAEGTKEAAAATEELTFKAHDLRGALYVLRPILQAAGIQMGQFGTLGRLAGLQFGAIAAAAAGAVVVGLARLEDAARTTKGQLEDLFQSKALSEKAFAGIQASALQFNTTVASITPGVEALKVAWERFITETRTFKFVAPTGGAGIGQIIPPGMVGSVESLQTAYDNFLKLLRAGRLDQAGATETAKAFFIAVQNGGKLTADILRTLPTGTINQLAQAMGRGQISTQQFINEVKLAPINLDKLIEALGRFTLESDAAFRINAIVTYKDKLGEILNTLSEGFKGLAGISFSDALVTQLERFNKVIQDDIRDLKGLIDLIKWLEQQTEMPWIGWLTQKARQGAASTGMPGTGITPEATGEETNKVWEAAGISARDRFARGFRDAPAAAADIATTAKSDATAAVGVWENIIESLKRKWEEWKQSLSGFQLGISPAGAAEFTGGPLLQQQQQQTQTQPIIAPFQEADNQIRTIWIALMDYIGTSVSEINFSPLTQALIAPFTNALPGIRDALLQVEQMIQEIMRQAAAAAGAIQQLNQGGRPGGGGSGGGFSFQEVASGGYIRGPGTATSDSIPAWLSNREYVIQARAVDHYGPNLFAALNSMRLPKDLFSRFAIGGLAKALSSAMPRYAAGGLATASGGRSLTIVLDGQRFGLNGSADVVDQFERVATRIGIAQIGRPPGWVR